jgi:hypothetical protein
MPLPHKFLDIHKRNTWSNPIFGVTGFFSAVCHGRIEISKSTAFLKTVNRIKTRVHTGGMRVFLMKKLLGLTRVRVMVVGVLDVDK